MKKYTETITKLHENEEVRLNEESEARIRLDEADFVKLVSGGQVEGGSNDHVKIILADIGYDRMIQIINDLKNKR